MWFLDIYSVSPFYLFRAPSHPYGGIILDIQDAHHYNGVVPKKTTAITQKGINMDYFDFTGETTVVDGVRLHQIIATEELPQHGVAAGDIGGYITSKSSLSGGAWVTPRAIITNRAVATNGALVTDNAIIGDDAYLSGGITIKGNAVIFGSARLMGAYTPTRQGIVVSDNATVGDNATVMTMTDGSTIFIKENARVCDNATVVGGSIVIADSAAVTGASTVQGMVCVDGDALLIDNSIASGNNPDEPTHITGSAILWEWVYVTEGCFDGSTLLPGM